MRVRRWIASLSVVCLLPACGIRDQERPVPLSNADLPPETAPAEAETDEVEGTSLFLVEGDRLRRVQRPPQPSLAAAITTLLAGPRETEASAGLRSAIPAGTTLLGTSIQDGEVRLDLSEEFTSIVGEQYLLAVAQVVYTATEITGLGRVNISIAGEPATLARDDGQLTAGSVGREDYASLAPP